MDLAQTASVQDAQRRYYGATQRAGGGSTRDSLGPDEVEFIQKRDSFYLSTVNENGWPYIQHRGGDVGFLHVLDQNTLAFADHRGNRQMLSTGNLARNDRVALFLMDYPRRVRLKILGHARVDDVRERPELLADLAAPGDRRSVERIFVIDVIAFDWNCPKYITPRYTAAEVEAAVAPLKQRIAELEAKLRL